MKEIKLTQGRVTFVDDDDYDKLRKYTWYTVKHDGKFYAERGFWIGKKHKSIKMHRQILELTDPRIQCDHKDGDSLNNQRHNLRRATNQQNSFNMKKKSNCSSQYKGVCWKQEKQKWCARIGVDGKRKHLGYFSDEIEAAKAYNRSAEQILGQFALLNIIPISS